MTAENRSALRWYFAWMGVGAGLSFGVLAILSIGIYILAVAIVATVFLARRSEARVGVAGLVSGFGLPLLYVAFLNRSGPGVVCTVTSTSSSCVERWSPWPWLVIGTAILVAGLAWFIAASYRRAGQQRIAHH
jgi:hypothetical protein